MNSSASDIFSLEGKTAVVTGTSAGIGARLARTLVMAGADVVAIARRRTELDDEAAGQGRLIAITADLSERDDVLRAAESSLEKFEGNIDILVNNAAYIAGGVKAENETYDDIRRTLAVNVEAPILLAQSFFSEHESHRKRIDCQHHFDIRIGRKWEISPGCLCRHKGGSRSNNARMGDSMEPVRHSCQQPGAWIY